MAHVLSGAELVAQRLPGQWSKSFLVIPEAHIIYSARLNGVPADFDLVAEISFDNASGTLAEVLADMTLFIGSSAGAYDLGMCRIRKAPIAGTFYIAETSEIVWVDDCYLTVVDDYSLWAKPLRIVSEIPYMDWDVAYSDQHEDFDPVPAMGCGAVARLSGATVDVPLGPSSDVPAWVIGSTIVSRLWSIDGATAIDDDTAVNPVATFDTAGTYLAYCLFTAANGKTFTGVRYIVIYDANNLPLTNFEIRNGKMDYLSGACSYDVTLFSAFGVSTLRKRSKVILCSEDFAGNISVTLPGQIAGRENILAIGWISEIDTSRQSEFGEISFTVESAEFWMKAIRDYPSGLELTADTASAWTQMPGLTVDRAAWHFLHWRSTATRIMDIKLTDDARYATRFMVARSNLWERIEQVARPTIFAAPAVDNFGRLFVMIDPQMVPEADRTWPVVMTLTDDDIQDRISWRRRDVQALGMLFFSGVAISATGGANSFFSMSPGHSYAHFGEEEPQDNYLVSDQEESNSLCALYYGWRNNDPYDLELDFVHSMRILGMFPRQYFYFVVDPADDPRAIGFAKNFILREISFDHDPDTAFISFSARLEPASEPGPAIDGDVPTMETIDFSYPNPLPKIPPLLLPASIPYTYPDPTEETENLPAKIAMAFGPGIGSVAGIAYTLNADDYDPFDPLAIKWQLMIVGMDVNDQSQIQEFVITPNGTMYVMTNGSTATGWGKIMRATALGGVWTTVFEPTDRVYEGLSRSVRIVGLGVNPYKDDEICIVDSLDYIAFGAADTARIYVGSTSFAATDDLFLKYNQLRVGIAFEANKWFVFGTRPSGIGGSGSSPYLYRFSAAGVQENNANFTTGAGQGGGEYYAAAQAGNLYLWSAATGNQAGYFIALPDLSFTFYDEATYVMRPLTAQSIAVSPAGTHAMGADNNGPFTPYKSADSLTSWSSVAGVIPIGSDVWDNCRDNFRWLFGGGSTGPRLTMDQGASYIELGGDLSVIAPVRDITAIRYIE